MKSVKITPPKGYIVDEENSTFEEIKFKPIVCLTIGDVTKKVFNTNKLEDAERNIAFSKLLQIARYYNGNWEPNWCNINEPKYYIYMCEDKYFINSCRTTPFHFVHFKNKADAQAVIDNPNFRAILNILYK